ncbi:hypothetical protein KP509_12G048600 [Ceratopteris richardii]|nr:hypothetical protein KP509_12G048600 [Ceratopteris richardii]
MQAVSFMYMRPPGYNAESARVAEITEEKKVTEDASDEKVAAAEEDFKGKKSRVKDLYGKTLPTEEEFPVLKNAPRLESGASARVKPFAVEIRNVKCVRCGTYGHQSGDRECPLKDNISAIDEARQKRDDPLTSIMSAMSNEPLKWELKQKPGGLSPPRGGFKRDDPNQQIIPEDIYDEYGGFLAGGGEIQDFLSSLPEVRHKKKKRRKHKYDSLSSECSSRSDDVQEHRTRKHKEKKKSKAENASESDGEHERKRRRRKGDESNEYSSENDSEFEHKRQRRKDKESKKRRSHNPSSDDCSSDDSESKHRYRRRKHKKKKKRKDDIGHSDSAIETEGDSDRRMSKNKKGKKFLDEAVG